MKSLLVFLIGSTAVLAQPIGFGVKGGVPMTDFLDTVSGSRTSISSTTNRYIVGPTVELRLPAGFGVEFDALYRHFRYNSVASLVDAVSTLRASGDAWEFPLVLKKRFIHGPVRPFLDAGVNFNKISGLSQTVQTLVFPNRSTTTTNNNPPELRHDFSTGFTMGAGLEVHALLLRVSPEIRYTRWGTQNFNSIISGGSLRSNVNQAEFLIGITF
jgi:opacity protein-like surface antigen